MATKQRKKSPAPVVEDRAAAPSAPSAPRSPPPPDRVALRAYEIWQESGCPAGQHEDHWYRAERELRAGAR